MFKYNVNDWVNITFNNVNYKGRISSCTVKGYQDLSYTVEYVDDAAQFKSGSFKEDEIELITKDKLVFGSGLDLNNLIGEISIELALARKKFPDNNLSTIALMEEVGELAKALLNEPWLNVRKEAIQVIVMAVRIVLEGDPSLKKHREGML